MSDRRIRLLDETAQEAAYATLTLAFAADPCERWLFPGAAQYLSWFPRFLEAFGGGAFAAGTAWGLDDCGVVGLWLPPEVAPDSDAIVDVLAAGVAPAQHEDMFRHAGADGRGPPGVPALVSAVVRHRPDPAGQGRGLGSILLAHCLERVDADRLPAYLETPNPRTIPFYQRHGFAVVATARAGASPPLIGMLRAAAG